MNQDPNESEQPGDETNRVSRRKYSAPHVVDSSQFETLALTCGKLSAAACSRRGGANIS